MLISLSKTALVAAVCIFFLLVAIDNVADYGTNWAFVRHVLAMDTIFPDSTLKSRAIASPVLASMAYGLIIGWEALTGVVLLAAVLRMIGSVRDQQRFAAAKPLAVVGLAMGLLLYGFGFLVIGGEWFAMWQSQSWNGVPSATRFIVLIGLTLLIVLAPDR